MSSWIRRLMSGLIVATSLQAGHLYVCGDLFRDLAQWRCDEREWFLDPPAMQYGDIVFVKSDYLQRFFDEVHPHIDQPYILLAHNSDDPVPGPCLDRLFDPMILHWYAQHMSVTGYEERITPIPIGVANPIWQHGNQKVLRQFAQRAPGVCRSRLFYLNFQPATNPAQRLPCEAYFLALGAGPNRVGISQSQYLTECLNSLFVVSPPGNAIDCHRTWEALILGCIPIVHSTTCDRLFDDLPVWVVQEWREVTAESAKKQNKAMRRAFPLGPRAPEKVYGSYWTDRILDHQARLRACP